jgi:hypothetical protein
MEQDSTIVPPRRFLIKDKEGLEIIAEGIRWMDETSVLKWRDGVEAPPEDHLTPVSLFDTIEARGWKFCWIDRSDKPHNSQCARCGASSGADVYHCFYCGASPNILVPKWFSDGTMERDKHRTDSLQRQIGELRYLRSRLPVPVQVRAAQPKVVFAADYEVMGEPNPYGDDDWAVRLHNVSTSVKAGSEEEARSKGAVLLSWEKLIGKKLTEKTAAKPRYHLGMEFDDEEPTIMVWDCKYGMPCIVGEVTVDATPKDPNKTDSRKEEDWEYPPLALHLVELLNSHPLAESR